MAAGILILQMISGDKQIYRRNKGAYHYLNPVICSLVILKYFASHIGPDSVAIVPMPACCLFFFFVNKYKLGAESRKI